MAIDWFQWGRGVFAVLGVGTAVQLQRQLGPQTSYKTAYMLLHKLRAAMVREGRERLQGVVEVDESYVGGPEAGGGGRHIGTKALVVGAVEVRGEHAGRVRPRVVPNASQVSLEKFLRENVERGTEVRTDAWIGYFGLTEAGYAHVPMIEGRPERATVILPHIHRVFSNLKTWLLGTHHGAVRRQHLQAYLNEFVFRYNRRGWRRFRQFWGLSAERRGPTYKGLHGIAKGETEYVHPTNPALRVRRRAD